MDCIKVAASVRAEIASKCGVVDAYLYQIFTRRKMAGAALCVAIEQASNGEISRKVLRPDDWRDIWPELADSEEKPTVAPVHQAPAAIKTEAPQQAQGGG